MDPIVVIITLAVLSVIGLPIAAIAGFVVTRRKLALMQQQIDALGEQLGDLQQSTRTTAERPATSDRPVTEAQAAIDATVDDRQEAAVAAALVSTAPEAIVNVAETPQVPQSNTGPESLANTVMQATTNSESRAPTRDPNLVDRFEQLLRRAAQFVTSYFTDGNLFVRIGILVLFFGVAFLLKYAAEHSRIPIEFRFIGAALGGIGLLLFGWRLRHRQASYGLLLQGAGIGVVYITIFAAFRLADLLPPLLTFALLVVFSATAVALALLQNSRALAIYAVLGGFLAPLLASSGSGNYIGLFSYYAVLNAAVFAIAWHRAWRALNLLGFLFTFGVFTLWVAGRYQPQNWLPAAAFLVLFLLMYSLIGVLYALRQPTKLSGLVDGSLVFGTPVVVSSLFMVMLRHHDYGIALAAAGMGVYYLLLARFAWQRIGEDFRLLAEAMLAIGVVFTTLAIPYALDGHWSTAAWALEAAGILWVSIRQQRFYAQCFAIALQFGAGLLFLLRNVDDVGTTAWLNPAFLGGVFIALGAFISARMLYLQATDFKLRKIHLAFYIWALGWWLVSALVQIDAYLKYEVAATLLLFAGSAALLTWLDRVRAWQWMPAAVSAALLLPVAMLIALYSLLDNGHLLVKPDLYAWIIMLGTGYWIICKLEALDWPGWITTASHTGLVTLATLILSFELIWLLDHRLELKGQAWVALFALLPLMMIRVAQRRDLPAIKRLGSRLQLAIIATLSSLLLVWGLLMNLSNSGDPAPLPYLPFVNPLDLSQIAFVLLALGSLRLLTPIARVQREQLLAALAAYSFVWLTAVLTRSLHHYLDIPFELSILLDDTRVQSAISILWTVIGMAAMLLASRRLMRQPWVAGATLMGVVLVKMFFVDLGASGTVERIVSFLVVGSLLVATGYFSPIPPRQAGDLDPGESAHA